MVQININLGDSLAAMKNYPDNHWDLAICDPPYGILKNSHGSGINGKSKKNSWTNKFVKGESKDKIRRWDNKSPNIIYYKQLCKVSKNQIIFGANHFNWGLFSECWIVWDKKTYIPSMSRYEIAYTSFSGHVADVCVNSNQKGRIHPTQKPVALYKWLLKNYGFNKDGSKRTIFDSHGGSLSIVIACIDMGFDIDIWEIDPDYYRDGVNRVKRHLDQLDLTRETVEINIK